YVVNGSVYFDVKKFNEEHGYGELSGRKIEDLISNTRTLDGQDEKRDSLDFALWKKANDQHLMKWPSPWGTGFPGWHLECSAMSTKYLGQTFDIHGGGMDLKFPHHECEIAQNIGATGKSPVNYWIHGNMLTVNGKKMAKSEGNGFTPEELMTGNHKLLERGYSAMTVRFFMLQCHYASTLDFSNEALQAAEKGFKKLTEAMKTMKSLEVSDSSDFDAKAFADKCQAAMNDDFNTPVTISVLFDGVRTINSVRDGSMKIDAVNLALLQETISTFFYSVLGFMDEGEDGDAGLASGLMEMLIDMRHHAKTNRNFELADQIRDELTKLNVQLKDSKEGSTWSHEG
ncbi:MAG: cysteinyl-tRNA synthetase, partial [Gammaproteobacteria bacterium]